MAESANWYFSTVIGPGRRSVLTRTMGSSSGSGAYSGSLMYVLKQAVHMFQIFMAFSLK